MKILDLYISRSFLRHCLLILAILVVLLSLLDLLAQLDEVGRHGYRFSDAILVVLLTLPKRMLDLLPITTLLGGITAMGALADKGELVGMEACGISSLRICATVLAASTLLIGSAALLGEFAIPRMEAEARARQSRTNVADQGLTMLGDGFWLRRGASFIRVERMLTKDLAENVAIFSFDEQGRLQSYIQARQARLEGERLWILHDIIRRSVSEDKVVRSETEPFLPVEGFLTAAQAGVLGVPPYSLSTPDLVRFIEILQLSGQNSAQYATALWRKFTVPLSTMAMALLALSFVFGSTRSLGAGPRIAIGSFVGIVLYFLDQITVQWGLIFGLPPLLTALLPVVLIAFAALFRLRSLFWRGALQGLPGRTRIAEVRQ